MDFQGSLFEAPPAGVGDFDRIRRRELGRGAWLDVLRTWIPAPDDVFETLVRDVPWRAERRQMYDRLVDVPRLLHTYMIGEQLPHPLLTEAREALSAHYADELGEPFRTAGCCYYRDGRDSVAWHGDTIGRGSTHDTMVAIVSCSSRGTSTSRSYIWRRSATRAGSTCAPAAAVRRSWSRWATATWW
jgi:alkylated DNA repair dioxygenase AlkB